MDPEETIEEQEKRITKYKKNGTRHFKGQGRVAQIIIDSVYQARVKVSENNVNGPVDSIVSEMIKQLPQENIHENTRCFQDRFTGQEDAPSSWRIVKLVFPRKPDAAPKKGIRSYRSITLTSVMSKWFATCVIFRLAMDKEPEGWKQVHVGGIDGISCQRSCCRNTGCGRKTGGRTCGMAGKRDPRCTWLAWTSRRPSTWQDQSVLRNLWAIKLFTDGLQRPYCEKWQAWQDRQHFEHVENNSLLRDASVRGALRHLGFGSKLQRRSCGMLSQNGREKRWESTLTHANEENIKPAVLFGWALIGGSLTQRRSWSR